MNEDASFNSPQPIASPIDRQLNEVEANRQAGEYAAALESVERIVRAHPKNLRALNEMGVCLRFIGEPLKASLQLRKAHKLAPDSPEVLANLGHCLRELGETDKAARAFEKALKLRPEFMALWAQLGELRHAEGRLDSAIAAYERCLSLNPYNALTMANLASARAEDGAFDRALEVAEQCLAIDSRERRALAVRGLCLHEVGREEEAARWLDLDWVREFPLTEVPGFESLEALNRDLAQTVMGHSTLVFEPEGRSTVAGDQTGELDGEGQKAVSLLSEHIRGSVERYLMDLPDDVEHPYLRQRPIDWRWNLWGTSLGNGGHQSPHIHPGGWVSGVYYAQLPEQMAGEGQDQQGWIEFGGAPLNWPLRKERPLRRLRPSEGSLVLFPSYLYHRTLPFEFPEAKGGKSRRISLAFDAIPASWPPA